MQQRVLVWSKFAATWLEYFLAMALLLCVVGFAVTTMDVIWHLDWYSIETFDEIISRVLMLAIGVELVRTLLLHNPEAILELLAFVVARKSLKPDITMVEILLSVTAFIALLAARKYLNCKRADTP